MDVAEVAQYIVRGQRSVIMPIDDPSSQTSLLTNILPAVIASLRWFSIGCPPLLPCYDMSNAAHISVPVRNSSHRTKTDE
jgi:hypothetical protein